MSNESDGLNWPIVFRIAALANWSVALAILVAPDLLYTILSVSPFMSVETKFYADAFAVMAAIFGLAYWWVAADPAAQRSLIWLGIIGKSAAVAIIWFHVLFLEGPLGFGLLIALDLVFVAVFIVYLRQLDA